MTPIVDTLKEYALILWLISPTMRELGDPTTAALDLSLVFVTGSICICYFPLFKRGIMRTFRGDVVPFHEMLSIGIFCTAMGIGTLLCYWGLWRIIPHGEERVFFLLLGAYISMPPILLGIFGYMIHLRSIWKISGRKNWSFVVLIGLNVCVFIGAFYLTLSIRA